MLVVCLLVDLLACLLVHVLGCWRVGVRVGVLDGNELVVVPSAPDADIEDRDAAARCVAIG